jgi:hypothetical protein
LGLEVLVLLWHYAASRSEATRSRWQWTWAGDDSVFKEYSEQLGLVSTWWSGQEHRVLTGIDEVLLVGLAAAAKRKPTVRVRWLNGIVRNQLSREEAFSGKRLMRNNVLSDSDIRR